MLTVGGIIYDDGHKNLVAKCGFENFAFVKNDKDSYCIQVPSLTLKEMRHLDKQLPCAPGSKIESPSIPEKDIQRYARLYRYFPSYVDAEVS